MRRRGEHDELSLHVGLRIRTLRHQFGLTMVELARRSGLNRKHLGQVERGTVSPKMETLFATAKGFDGFGITVPDLLNVGIDDDFGFIFEALRHRPLLIKRLAKHARAGFGARPAHKQALNSSQSRHAE